MPRRFKFALLGLLALAGGCASHHKKDDRHDDRGRYGERRHDDALYREERAREDEQFRGHGRYRVRSPDWRRDEDAGPYDAEDRSAVDESVPPPAFPVRPTPRPLSRPAGDRRVVLGDCGLVLAEPGGRVDVAKTIAALTAMHANTFAYSIGQTPAAWAQLPEFADAARAQGIDVWVYLFPWSETPQFGKMKFWCEPYRLDFVAWAKATAALARQHPNVTGILIDDFAGNDFQPDRFTPAYVRQIKAALTAGDSGLTLQTILYCQQRWGDFMDRYGDTVDAAVVCYPAAQAQIESAAAYLSGSAHGAALLADLGRHDTGDDAATSMQTRLRPPPGGRLRFLFDASNISKTPGTHTAFVKVDGKTIWSHKVSATATVLNENLEIPSSGGGKGEGKKSGDEPSRTIALGVTGQRDGQTSEFVMRFDDVAILNADGTPARQPQWTLDNPGRTIASLQQPGGGSPHGLPMYLMPAAAPFEYVKRFGQPADLPAAIARHVQLCLGNVRTGKAAGVVNFFTPKEPGDPVLGVVSDAFASATPVPQRTR